MPPSVCSRGTPRGHSPARGLGTGDTRRMRCLSVPTGSPQNPASKAQPGVPPKVLHHHGGTGDAPGGLEEAAGRAPQQCPVKAQPRTPGDAAEPSESTASRNGGTWLGGPGGAPDLRDLCGEARMGCPGAFCRRICSRQDEGRECAWVHLAEDLRGSGPLLIVLLWQLRFGS